MTANGKAEHDPLDEVDSTIATLEGTEWVDEETGETNIIVQPGGVVNVEQTGKHKAYVADGPPSKLSPLAVAWLAVRRMPPWGVVLVALAGIAAYVALRR